jgi:hypothetical protein
LNRMNCWRLKMEVRYAGKRERTSEILRWLIYETLASVQIRGENWYWSHGRFNSLRIPNTRDANWSPSRVTLTDVLSTGSP